MEVDNTATQRPFSQSELQRGLSGFRLEFRLMSDRNVAPASIKHGTLSCHRDLFLKCNVLNRPKKCQVEFHDQGDGVLHQDLARAMVINALPPDRKI